MTECEFKVGDKVRHRLNNRKLTVERIDPDGLYFYAENLKWRRISANYILIEPVKEEKVGFEVDTPSYPHWVRVIPAQAERLEIIPNTIFLEGAIGRPKMQVGAGMGKSIHLEIGSGGGIFSVEGLRRYSKVFASLADVMEKINEQ